MAHITEFTIEGLNGRLEPFSAKLDRQLNVFFGVNGCGKTSLLKILASAMRDDATMLSRVPFSSAIVTIHSTYYDRTFVRSITKTKGKPANKGDRSRPALDFSSIDYEDVPSGSTWTTTPPRSRGNQIEGLANRYLPTTRLFPQEEIAKMAYLAQTLKRQPPDEQIDLLFSESVKRLWISYTSSMLSEINKSQQTGLTNIFKAVLSPRNADPRQLDWKMAYERMKKFVARQASETLLTDEASFKKRYTDDPILRKVVADIDDAERQIEKFSAPRNRLEKLVKSLLSERKTVIFSDQDIQVRTREDEDIGISSLSSGEKQVLRLLLETALGDQSAIIIDEPELSLHIDWQSRLLQMMRTISPNAQLIIATHSPEIMASVSDDCIFRM